MVVRVLQFTDTHLFATAAGRMKGVDTSACLAAVVEQAFSFHEADIVVLTGDLSQDESEESYINLADLLSRYHREIHWLPGNHDCKPLMKEVFSAYPAFKAELSRQIGPWRFLFLDSAVEGRVEGELSASELARARTWLVENSGDCYRAIFLHHNPVTMDSRREDRMMLRNSEVFEALLAENGGVEAVIFGHVHQDCVQGRGRTLYIASPSTCVQFRPTATGLTIDRKAPGYRYIEFAGDGAVKTETFRVGSLPEGLKLIEGDL